MPRPSAATRNAVTPPATSQRAGSPQDSEAPPVYPLSSRCSPTLHGVLDGRVRLDEHERFQVVREAFASGVLKAFAALA
jgi:hypothetical protein